MAGALKINFERVRDELDSLVPGQLVEIHWADASINRRVKRMSNSVVACYKKLVGWFLELRHDTAYGIEHCLLTATDGMVGDSDVISIPVPVILNVIPIRNKPWKIASKIGSIYLGGGKRKIFEQEGGIGQEWTM